MKKKLGIIAIIMFTILCVYLGIQRRKVNAINITQIQTQGRESLSYMIKTKNDYIVMIDGGNYDDSEHLEEVLMANGGVVTHWYITIAHNQNFGALQKIIENGNIKIENIYISFNAKEWYKKYEYDRVEPILEFLEVLEANNQNYAEIPANYEIQFDDLYITALNWKNPDFHADYAGFNQSMVIKIDNMYKSIIFTGDIANKAGQFFKDNHLDEIDCDAVQISNNGMQYVDDEVYQKMTPKYLFMPVPIDENNSESIDYANRLKELLKSDSLYLSNNGDITVTIW